MNPQPEVQSETLRSDIDNTRERMDETIDALGDRFRGRHLVDEVIGFIRGRSTDGRMNETRERLAHTAETAVHTVVDTVKAHPIPTVMIGAGIAWLIYESRSSHQRSGEMDTEDLQYTEYDEGTLSGAAYAPAAGAESEPSGVGAKAGELASGAKGKLSQLGESARERLANAGARSRETVHSAKERIGHLAGDLQQRSHEVYDRTRERVVTTADRHPLEVGLGCLAVGLLVGLAMPTPRVVNRRLGPTVDRLKDRTREAGSEWLEKGKRVAQAAASAAKAEAKTQGLTVARVRDQNQPAGESPGAAAAGVGSETSATTSTGGGQPGSTDPSSARPGV